MADIPTAKDIGHLIVYVAPGYFAQATYTFRYPRRSGGDLRVLITSVAVSLPLVAATQPLARYLDVAPNPLAVRYVALLLGVSVVAGYLLARLRGAARSRGVLEWLDLPPDPEGTVMQRALMRLPTDDDMVTVTFKDGRVLSGIPRFGTDDPESEVRELFLRHSAWWNPDRNDWLPRQAGILLNMDDVHTIEVPTAPG